MLAELIFVTRILGLVAGKQTLNVQVDRSVHHVDLLVDGAKRATLEGAPWRSVVDLGPDLAPHELTAIAFDSSSHEIERDTQLINLARPPAEAAVTFDRDADNHLRATVRWKHIALEKPKAIEVKLDGETVGSAAVVTLPLLKGTAVHDLIATVTFRDGVVARKEVVFGGHFSEEIPTELTAIVAHEKGDVASQAASCFRLNGEEVTPHTVEKGDALVVFIREVDTELARMRLGRSVANSYNPLAIKRTMSIYGLPNIRVKIVWPVAQSIQGENAEAGADLFLHSEATGEMDTMWVLAGNHGPSGEQRFADAAAVAGVSTLNQACRRMVVLVLGQARDRSQRSGMDVRRYLDRIGVPFQVWSLLGVKDDVVREWGDVVDISDPNKLRRATENLRHDLDSQRVVWLPLNPLDALRVTAVPGCSFAR